MTESFQRDANHIPITTDGLVSSSTKSLVGNNTTVAVPIFGITGVVEVRGIWGVVTTTLGVNVTAAAWRLNDQTAQTDITLATGTNISGKPVGSLISKTTTNGSALSLLDSAAGRITETAANHMELQCFDIVQKNGITTNIEFVYATTDTPTSGAIQFFLRWLPRSANGNVVSL